MTEPAPYPPHRRGEKFRWLHFPTGAPDRTPPEEEKVTGPDGVERTHRTGLPGLAPAAADPGDLGVSDWRPVE